MSRVWLCERGRRSWISCLVPDPDSPAAPVEVVVYCGLCAEREFEYVSTRMTPRP